MEKDNLQEEMMRLSDLYDIWGCDCKDCDDEKVNEELNTLKEKFEEKFEKEFEAEFGEKFRKNKIYYLINAVKKLKKG